MANVGRKSRPLPVVPTDIKQDFTEHTKEQAKNPHPRKHSTNKSESREAEQKNQDNLSTDLFRNLDNRTGHTLLALKGILLVAAIVLISSTKEISKAKPCDLEKVLVSLSVDNISSCKYDDIKKKSTTLCYLGISFLVLNAIIFLLILNFLWIPKNKKFGICVALEVIAVVAVVYSGLTIHFYTEVLDTKERQADTNYAQIKSSMIARLEKNYTSDNVSSGDAISDSWNKFFIEVKEYRHNDSLKSFGICICIFYNKRILAQQNQFYIDLCCTVHLSDQLKVFVSVHLSSINRLDLTMMLTLTLIRYLFDSFQRYLKIHLPIDFNLNVPLIKFKYECCAIDQVTGTTNDFDRTPWCTTSGSCQATASQIPKTCCNYVTEDNYQSAPATCHSSVNSGTYKSNCMIPIKKLSTIHIEEYHLSLLLITLMTIGTLEIAEILIEGIYICNIYRLKKRYDQQKGD